MSATDNPTTWLEGFAKLSLTNPPCPGYRAEDWKEVNASAKAFLETRGAEAAGKGWTGIDLLAVDERVGASNVSACGALMLSTTTAPAEEITPEYIRFGRMRYFRMKMQSAVLVWRCGRSKPKLFVIAFLP